MKFSLRRGLVSATSIFALFAADVGFAHAVVLTRESEQINIYDLVHDGDATATSQDLSIAAAVALRMANIGWREAGFTGLLDRAARAGDGFPAIPLGAAPGTKPDNDFASSASGSGATGDARWDAQTRARATGRAMIAPLIGTIGNGSSPNGKSGGTVFVAEGSQIGFTDGGALTGGVGGALLPNVSASSSTRTAAITVAGGGSTSRQNSRSVPYVATAVSGQSISPTSGESGVAVVANDTVQRPPGYRYAPAGSAEAKGNMIAASFADAVTSIGTTTRTAAGVATQTTWPAAPATNRSGDLAGDKSKLAELARKIQGAYSITPGDGVRTLLSASVSVDPSVAAARYLASVIKAAATSPVAQSVAAFQIGPESGIGTPAGAPVADPLRGKILAGGGALNSSLALP